MIRLVLDPATREGNLSRNADQSLVDDDGLDTVMTISLFTDAQAPVGLLPPGADRRGYLFDRFDEEEPDLVTGSLIWTVTEFETLSEQSLASIRRHAEDATAWMIAARAASRIEYQTTRVGDDGAELIALVYKPNDTNSPYKRTWELKFAVQ